VGARRKRSARPGGGPPHAPGACLRAGITAGYGRLVAWAMAKTMIRHRLGSGTSQAAQEAQRSWVTVAEYAVATALATDVYNDVKAAGKAVVDKIRKPPDPPPPSGSDGEA